jgi:hypothetical protein
MSFAACFLITAYLPAETLQGLPLTGKRKNFVHYALFLKKTPRNKIR